MCGIFSIINQEETLFDYQTFCTLGAANDRRGGDSCGIFIDGRVEYGIGDKAKFEDFFWSSEVLNNMFDNKRTAKIALGHDRKASVGGVSLDKAHPILIKETVGEGEEAHEEIKFVMVHNGTIYNYEELAKKYIPQIDIKDMSDSQVIARLLYYSGFDWLAEYNGGTAFIAVDYRKEKPKVLIWRGESKKFSTDKELEEERPLFCNTTNGRLVLSSIASYIAITDGNCFLVPANEVLTYYGNKLWSVQKIDRSNAQQNRKYEAVTYNYRSPTNVVDDTPQYLKTIFTSNTYKVGDKAADGSLRLSLYGKILTKYDTIAGQFTYDIYFFNGIALKEFKAYKFLCKVWKRSGLSLKQFTIMYANLIRFFSVDQIYFEGTTLYKAITPWTRTTYTGSYQMLSETVSRRYVNGVYSEDERIRTVYESYDCLKVIPTFDYKTIWKEFIQSMG